MIGVDVGGTFTDIIALEAGQIRAHKVPTNVRETHLSVLASADCVDVPGALVFNHASTHGLNALLTRRLPKVGFLTTEGHRDMLDMGGAWRPPEALTDPHWRRSFGDSGRPLVPRYLRRGIRERMQHSGEVFIELDDAQAREQLEILKRCEVEGVAICLLNSYANPSHEQKLAELAREVLGDIPISVSSSVSPLAREYPRASTTVVDVMMKIVYVPYTRRLQSGLAEAGFSGQFNFADCAAQLIPADEAMVTPSRVVFSGPSAGAVASAYLGKLIGKNELVCADVGGTSCDISIVQGGSPKVQTTFEVEFDLVVNTLSTNVHAIGAGGGSIVGVTSAGEITVGPGSAGADPGPACYGKGGEHPTTTDACLLIGILDPDRFAGGRLDVDAARDAFERLPAPGSLEQKVSYAYGVAVNNIAEGIFNEVVKAGVDPRDFDLMAYGAGGPMLLPAVLDKIHVRSVIIPPHAGLFSAIGLLSADRVFAHSRTRYLVLGEESAEEVNDIFERLESELRERLGGAASDARFVRTFDGCLLGQVWETPFVEVPAGTIGPKDVVAMIDNFHETYLLRTGGQFKQMPVQGVTYRVSAVLPTPKVEYPVLAERAPGERLTPASTTTLRYLADDDMEAAVYERGDFRLGDVIVGPAVVREELATTHILSGQVARVGTYGELVITRADRDGQE